MFLDHARRGFLACARYRHLNWHIPQDSCGGEGTIRACRGIDRGRLVKSAFGHSWFIDSLVKVVSPLLVSVMSGCTKVAEVPTIMSVVSSREF